MNSSLGDAVPTALGIPHPLVRWKIQNVPDEPEL
jgi:hypothetical protein